MAFPDPVALTITYLAPLRAPVPVVSRVPQTRPDRLVQVRRIGGATQLVRDVARLDVFTWGTDDADAMALALEVRADLWALAGTTLLGPACYRVAEFLSPRHADDDRTGSARVWATYELTIRADDVIHRAP